MGDDVSVSIVYHSNVGCLLTLSDELDMILYFMILQGPWTLEGQGKSNECNTGHASGCVYAWVHVWVCVLSMTPMRGKVNCHPCEPVRVGYVGQTRNRPQQNLSRG